MSLPQAPQPSPGSSFVGWLLIVFGALLVLLCGGCTLTIVGTGVVGLVMHPTAEMWGAMVGSAIVVLLIGGVPTAGGAILVWAGWRMLHPIRTPKEAAKTFE